MKALVILLIICMASCVCASSYSIDFRQDGGKLVVSENINGNITNFVTSDGLDRIVGGYYFIKRIDAKENFSSFIVRLTLAEGMVANINQTFPAGYKTETDGQTITFVWNYSNVHRGDSFAYFVTIEKKNFLAGQYLIIFFSVILIGFILYKFFLHSKKGRNIEKYLLDEERKIVELLKKADRNELWQKKIQLELTLSKAKCSRLIRNLESRGLIEKISFGNTNKIKLK